MKTQNWQTKALTLFIAVAALGLTAACGSVYPIIITPSAPCGDDDGPAEVSIEFQGFPSWYERDTEKGESYPWEQAIQARRERLRPEEERARAIKNKYHHLIGGEAYYADFEGSHYWDYTIGVGGQFIIEEGLPADKMIIWITTDHYIVESINRIPECVEGIPVHFRIEGPPEEIYDDGYGPLEGAWIRQSLEGVPVEMARELILEQLETTNNLKYGGNR